MLIIFQDSELSDQTYRYELITTPPSQRGEQGEVFHRFYNYRQLPDGLKPA